MSRRPECDRCGEPSTSDEPLTTVNVCLDNTSVTLNLDERCTRNVKADVGAWLMYGAEVAAHRSRAAALSTRPSVFTALPERREPLNGDQHIVPIPIRRREVTIPAKEPALVAPEILNGRDQAACLQATMRWSIPKGIRTRLLENNIDPIDALLAADVDYPDRLLESDSPGFQGRVYNGVCVIVNVKQKVIVDAFPSH